MTETKTDVVLLIDRVRRNTTNLDVIAVCDLLERAVASTQRSVASTNGDVVSTRKPAVASTCEHCDRRRATKARAQKKWRAKPKKRINPLDAD